jgi:hypothetical protein
MRKKALALTSDEEPVSTTADVQVARRRCSDEVMLVLAELASAVEKQGNLLRDITSRKEELDVLVRRLARSATSGRFPPRATIRSPPTPITIWPSTATASCTSVRKP